MRRAECSVNLFLPFPFCHKRTLHVYPTYLYDNDPNRFFTWNFFAPLCVCARASASMCSRRGRRLRSPWHGISIVIACYVHRAYQHMLETIMDVVGVAYTETIENCRSAEAMAECWSIYLKHAMPICSRRSLPSMLVRVAIVRTHIFRSVFLARHALHFCSVSNFSSIRCGVPVGSRMRSHRMENPLAWKVKDSLKLNQKYGLDDSRNLFCRIRKHKHSVERTFSQVNRPQVNSPDQTLAWFIHETSSLLYWLLCFWARPFSYCDTQLRSCGHRKLLFSNHFESIRNSPIHHISQCALWAVCVCFQHFFLAYLSLSRSGCCEKTIAVCVNIKQIPFVRNERDSVWRRKTRYIFLKRFNGSGAPFEQFSIIRSKQPGHAYGVFDFFIRELRCLLDAMSLI